VLTRRLRRLLDMLVTQVFLERYRSERGELTPRIPSLNHPPSLDV
jgi:hypothetical protein